jgi:hypothetical protein
MCGLFSLCLLLVFHLLACSLFGGDSEIFYSSNLSYSLTYSNEFKILSSFNCVEKIGD